VDREAISLATVFCIAGAGVVTAEVMGPGAAPLHLVLAVALFTLGLGVLAARGLSLAGRQTAAAMGVTSLVVLLSLTWSPLLRIGHALLAGTSQTAPHWWELCLLLLLPVGVPCFLLGACLALVRNLRRRSWPDTLPRTLAGSAVWVLGAGVFAARDLPGWPYALVAAGALMLGALSVLRKKAADDAGTDGYPPPAAAFLFIGLLGLGLGTVLRGLWRGWETLQGLAPSAWAPVLGAALLLGGMALGCRLARAGEAGAGEPERRSPAYGLAALAVLVLLLPAWPPLLRLLAALLEPGGPGTAWLVQALLTVGLCGVAAAFAATAAVARWGGALTKGTGGGWLLLGTGLGWALASFVLLPPLGFSRTAGIGVLIGLLGLVFLRGRGLPAAPPLRETLAGGLSLLAVVLLLAWPPDPLDFHAVDPGGGERLVLALDDPAAPLVIRTRPDGAEEVVLAGRVLGRGGPRGLENRVMAGHLPFLLQKEIQSAVVVTAGPDEAARALAAHGVAVDLRVPARACEEVPGLLSEVAAVSPGEPILKERILSGWPGTEGLRRAASRARPGPAVEPRTAAGLLLPESLDLLVTLLPDPGHPFAAPWYRPAFYRRAAAALGEKGLLVQLVDLSSLAPPGVEEVLSAASSEFARVDLWSFDLGLEGEYLLVASASPPLALPYTRLLPSWLGAGPGTERLRYDLERSGLAADRDILQGIVLRIEDGRVAGALARDAAPRAARPGTAEARDSLLRLLYGRQQRAWPIRDTVRYRRGGHYLVPVELQTSLAGWDEKEGRLQVLTQVVGVPGVDRPGIYREMSPTVTIASRATSLTATATPMVLPDRDDITAPLIEAGAGMLAPTGNMAVNGHPAYWLFLQATEAPRDQTLMVSWFCPTRGNRYTVSYRTLEGSPNKPEPLAAWVSKNVRCDHVKD